jgi:hypothetical protein
MAKSKQAEPLEAIERYGTRWPLEEGWNDIQIELYCYIRDHKVEDGGLGKLGHLRNAMQMLWPKLYAGEQEEGVPRWRDEIELMCWAWCNYRVVAVIGHASAAKCLGKGTPVMLYDGTVLPVEDVKPGMQLMGDDSTPRNVLSVATGREQMYRLHASDGTSWECNESHILSLKASYVPRKLRTFSKGDVQDVPLREFMGYGQVKRRTWKQYRVGVEFPKKTQKPLLIDPYVFGLWIGDGTKTEVEITQHDSCAPVIDFWTSYWEAVGLRVTKYETKDRCPRYRAVGDYERAPYRRYLREILVDGEKRIPHRYLTSSRVNRLRLLAGIIDTDGTPDKSAFTVTTKDKPLANDIAYLARSLGFFASVNESKTSIKKVGYVGVAYRIYISGDVKRIPTLLKFAAQKKSTRDPLLQEILRVESLGEGDYFGFTVDGNHRFLLGDFTVTHNTHTFAHIIAASYLASPMDTIATLTSTHLPGLRKRFWAETVAALNTSSATRPTDWHVRAHDLTARPAVNPKEDKYIIEGIAVDRGEEAVEKIQGNHSRMHRYVAIDEAQGTGKPIFDAVANLMSDQDFRFVMLANPTKKYSEFGSWCEPKNGWNSVDADSDLWWETKRGGVCIRLDGLRSPNIRLGRTVFPFLITPSYLEQVEKSYGKNSPRYWIFARGWFPPDGLMGYVFPTSVIARADKKIEYSERPTKLASLDPAFEGGDDCVLTIAEAGTNWKVNPLKQIPIIVAVSEGSDPLDYLIAHEVMRICQLEGVAPGDFIMDTTGAGRGVYAILQKEWSPDVQKCNFGGNPTDRRLKVGEDETCKDLFDRFVTELWWSARAFMEEGWVGNLTGEFGRLREQLAAREYETVNEKKTSIETKREMKNRVGYSPDYADSFVMIFELLKRRGALAGDPIAFVGGTKDLRHLKRAVAYSKIDLSGDNFAHFD